jgi:response regulator RpfG family c-di-GMP phosphodiesterase
MTPSSVVATAIMTVLFVDDEPAILRSIARALQGSPFDVLTAQSAAAALALMRQRRVDVLISDIDMPEMTGLELLTLVRREFPSTLRMLLTGAGTMDRALEAINEGEVHRFFTKPFDFELFLATMKRLAERIEKLRGDHFLDAHKARRDEFYRWVEDAFPGTLEVARNDRGELVVDLPPEVLQLLDGPPPSRPGVVVVHASGEAVVEAPSPEPVPSASSS